MACNAGGSFTSDDASWREPSASDTVWSATPARGVGAAFECCSPFAHERRPSKPQTRNSTRLIRVQGGIVHACAERGGIRPEFFPPVCSMRRRTNEDGWGVMGLRSKSAVVVGGRTGEGARLDSATPSVRMRERVWKAVHSALWVVPSLHHWSQTGDGCACAFVCLAGLTRLASRQRNVIAANGFAEARAGSCIRAAEASRFSTPAEAATVQQRCSHTRCETRQHQNVHIDVFRPKVRPDGHDPKSDLSGRCYGGMRR